MASIILKSIATPTQVSDSSILNTIKPLDYQQWIKQNVGIIPSNAENQYQSYLMSWYSNKNTQGSANNTDTLKADYIGLLKKISLIFKNDAEFERVSKINFDSPTELKLAIPYFAKKLKEIALYFASKREDLKSSKLQYNLVGSSNALEKILYEQLLKAFTKNTTHISSQDVYSSVPELSAVNTDFSIQIEELYDTHNYYTDTSAYPLSSTNPLLFVLEDYIANLYNAVDISDIPLSGLANPLSQFVVCETESDLNVEILAQLGQKRLGTDMFYLTGGFYTPNLVDVALPLQQGNNYFYWFKGEYAREIPEGQFKDKIITDIDWTSATGASAFDSADIIWANVGNVKLEGAWLMDSAVQTVNAAMTATMTNGKQFKFPYPGIGASAEGLEWTGKTITDIVEPSHKFFPSESAFLVTQSQITDMYWSATNSVSSINSMLLQDTTLADVAFASNKFTNADKILVRRNVGADDVHDISPDGVFQGDFEMAWLYNFNQTELAIKAGTNNIYYPLTSYGDASELFFLYDSGAPIALSGLNVAESFSGAVAGSTVANSDMLIKLNSICGPEIEGAFLKGFPLSAFNSDIIDCTCNEDQYIDYYTRWRFINGVTQPALAFKCDPGSFVRFVWTGPDTNLNDVIQGFQHDHACPYFNAPEHHSLLDTNFLNKSKKDVFEQWKICTCKTVEQSPLGHNGSTFSQYRINPDFVAKDTTFPANFSFNTWKGNDSLPYNVSNDVAWFRTRKGLESDIGWSEGEWLSNNDEQYILENGQTYWYYRSDINRCGFDLPSIIVNSGYPSCKIKVCSNADCVPVWQKATLDDNGNWVDANQISDMVLESGKFYSYNHMSTYGFSKSILTLNGSTVTTSGDYISLSAVDPAISYNNFNNDIPSVNFLIKVPLEGNDPYWGFATFDNTSDTANKLKMYGTTDVRFAYEYLQVTQPSPSNLVLADDDVIEYRTSGCNDCFIWTQPLTFNIAHPIRQWNKIEIDECVASEILNHLHSRSNETACPTEVGTCYSSCQEANLCSCDNLCYVAKTGVTATNIPSELVFNTELSGIPVFVNYYARNPYTLDFQVEDVTDGGTYVPAMSTIFSEATIPWMNLSNDFYPGAALEQTGQLYSKAQRGLFTPENLGSGKWELHAGKYQLATANRSASSAELFRGETDFPVIVSDSTWMKKDLSHIQIGMNQTFYPYTTNTELNAVNAFGLQENYILDYASLSANDRGQKLINCGPNAYYTNIPYLTGNVIDWHQDIWGNQYFVINPQNVTRLENASTFSKVYIKLINGELIEM